MVRSSCTAFACFLLVADVGGFAGPSVVPNVVRGAADSSNQCSAGDTRTVHMTMATSEGSSRAEFIRGVVGGGALGLSAAVSPVLSKPAAAAAAAESIEELEADLLLCKEVFVPTLQYLKAEQFDAARTNTNYITRFFNLKKKVDALIIQANDVVDDTDKLEKAFDMAQEVEALFTNFDSSVYTIIFIPADASGVLPPGAEKYLKQAYGYYDDIIKVLDFYIGLVPSETKAAAEKLVPAKRAALPKFLFKEDSALMKEKVAIS